MNRIKLSILILIFSCITGCSYAKDTQQTSKTSVTKTQLDAKNISTKDLINMVNTPTTPIELLENLKFTMENGLLLREDFYTEENLKQFFGPAEQYLFSSIAEQNSPNFVNVSIGKLQNIKIKQADGTKFSPYVSFRGFKNEQGKLKVSAKVNFTVEDSELSYAQVEPLFYPHWQLLPPSRWTSNMIYQQPTAPHGNETWAYTRMQSDTLEEHINVKFNANAQVSSVTYSLEQK